jgi:8-oxo-dGTP pyrophosphatase MutT (NUDIX family)
MEQQRILSFRTNGGDVKLDELREKFSNFKPNRDDIRGDHDLNAGFKPTSVMREAAVLIPIIKRDDGLTVLFTKRTDHLANHPGQISFPGGHREEHDETPDHAALRETEEEVGLPTSYVQVIGRLNDYITRTGFRVTPVVGLVDVPFPVKPDPYEVAEVFEVPLAFLMDQSNHKKCSRIFMEKERFFWAMPYDEYYIWGATAGMLRNFYEFLQGD